MTLNRLGKTTEEIQDIVGSLIGGSGDANVTYDDVNNQLSVDVSTIDPSKIGELRGDILELTRDNDRLRFDLGLTQLGFDDGQFDTYVDNSKVASTVQAETTYGAGDTGRVEIDTVFNENSTQANGASLGYSFDALINVEKSLLEFTGTGNTTDPSITISSNAGKQNVSYSGTIADGETVDLSSDIDELKIYDGLIELLNRIESNGDSFSYDASAGDVTDSTLLVTGSRNSSTKTVSGTLKSGNINANIRGNVQPPNTTLTMEGNGFGSRTHTESYTGVQSGHTGSFNLYGSLTTNSIANGADVTVTGTSNTETEIKSGTTSGLSDSTSLSVGGNADPSQLDTLQVTAPAEYNTYNDLSASADRNNYGSKLIGDIDGPIHAAVRIEPPSSGTISKLELNSVFVQNSSYNPKVNVYISPGTPDKTWEEGTLVKQGWQPDSWYGTLTVDNLDYQVSAGSYTVDFITQSSDNDGTNDYVAVESAYVNSGDWFARNGYGSGATANKLSVKVYEKKQIDSLSVSDGTGSSLSLGSFGSNETVTKDIDITTNSSKLDFSGSGSISSFDYTLTYKEKTVTQNPSVTLNGQTKSTTAKFNNGQQTTFSFAPSYLNTGVSNDFTLSLKTLTTDAPAHTADYSIEAEEIDGTLDPSVDINGDGIDEVSYTGLLTTNDTYSETISPTLSDDSWSVSASGNDVMINADITERVDTENPSIEIVTDDGTQTVSYSGVIPNGTTKELSSQIDTSLIGGNVSLNTTVSDTVLNPMGQVNVNHRATADALVSPPSRKVNIDVSVNSDVDFKLLSGANQATATHQTKDLGFVPVEVTLNDDVAGNKSAVTYTIEDGNGNTVSVPRTDVDTIVDCSNFTSSTITVTATISDLQTDLLEWGAYFN